MKKYNDTLLYSFFRPQVLFLMKLLFRIEIINNDKIQKDKKIILAGNHTSKLDPFLVMSTTKRHIHFLAKKELFTGLTGIIINKMGLVSVDRQAKDKKNVFINANNYLNNNKIIGKFPEGTTEKDKYPNLLPFKKGAVRLSYETDTEIIPFKIIGRYKLFRKSVKIVFGESLKATKDLDESNNILHNTINNMKE